MNEAIAVRARKLRKTYRIYSRPVDALWESMMGRRRHVERIALDSIDLDLHRGEIVGILGRNGAGKSTLLKIISGTLDRSDGELYVHGRITAMLELGTGFHPEYTGRENIYMGGLCLGMSRGEIEKKVDSIIDFSELRDFIDQPFKTYSTGMQARLAFSTAISVDPDILIVDEALSVGDARFQMKCYSWMQKLRERNCTILLVSHDTNTITSFCDRAIILENGRIHSQGTAKETASEYLKVLFGTALAESAGSHRPLDEKGPVTCAWNGSQPIAQTPQAHTAAKRFGNGKGTIVDFGLEDGHGKPVHVVESGSSCQFYMLFHFHQDVEDVSCGFAIKDRRGTVVFGVTNISQNLNAYHARACEDLMVRVDLTIWLSSGDYFFNIGAGHLANGEMIDFMEDAIHLKVLGPNGIFTTSVANLQARFMLGPLADRFTTGRGRLSS